MFMTKNTGKGDQCEGILKVKSVLSPFTNKINQNIKCYWCDVKNTTSKQKHNILENYSYEK